MAILPLVRGPPRMRARRQLGNALHLDGRAIREHFRDSLHHLGGVIAHGDNRVGAVFGSMLQEQFKSILGRLLAKICKDGDVPTYNGLKRGPEIANYAPRAHDDSAYDPKIPHNPIPPVFPGRT